MSALLRDMSRTVRHFFRLVPALLISLSIGVGCGKVEIRGLQKLDFQLKDLQSLAAVYHQLLTNQQETAATLKTLGFTKVDHLKTTNETFRLSKRSNHYLFGIEEEGNYHVVIACSAYPRGEASKRRSALSQHVIVTPDRGCVIIRTSLPPVPGCIWEGNGLGQIVALVYPPSALERFAAAYPELLHVLRAQENRVAIGTK